MYSCTMYSFWVAFNCLSGLATSYLFGVEALLHLDRSNICFVMEKTEKHHTLPSWIWKRDTMAEAMTWITLDCSFAFFICTVIELTLSIKMNYNTTNYTPTQGLLIVQPLADSSCLFLFLYCEPERANAKNGKLFTKVLYCRIIFIICWFEDEVLT